MLHTTLFYVEGFIPVSVGIHDANDIIHITWQLYLSNRRSTNLLGKISYYGPKYSGVN